MLYDLTPFQQYLQTEPPKELAKAIDEAMYDVVLNAEQGGVTEGLSQRYFTLKQLRDVLCHLKVAAHGNPRD